MKIRRALAIFCLAMLAGVAHADSLYVRLVGRYDAGSIVWRAATSGDFAYLATGWLRVISIADPAHPVEVGSCDSLGSPRGVAASGGYAYVADDSRPDLARLRVVSVADPSAPVEVGSCALPGAAYDAVLDDGFVYVPGGDSGLSVVSIADPVHPVLAGRCTRLGYAYNVAVSGDYAYVAAGGSGMRIISVADPTNPTVVGHFSAPGNIMAVAVEGQHAYVAVSDSTFRVLSIADPTDPVEVGQCCYSINWSIAAPQDLEVTHGYAFLATWGGLRIIDIAEPAYPVEVGHYGPGWSNGVALHRDYVYFTSNQSLVILQFYQPGDLDIDNDSLDVRNDTLRLRRWTPIPGDSLECVSGEFIFANTSASYNPDSIDGPSVSPVESLYFTVSLSGPGGTLDSVIITNLPESLAQGQTLVCTLAAYVPPRLRDGDYSGSIFISGKDTAGLQVYESCYVFLQKLGDLDVDSDSLDVVADTIRLWPMEPAYPLGTRSESSDDSVMSRAAIGEFILANTSESYNPDSADGPSLSPVDSLSFTGSLTGQSGTIDSIIIPSLPQTLARGQAIVCTLAVYVPPELRDGDYAGSITITGKDSVGAPIQETFSALVRNVLGDLDVDNESLDAVHDTMAVRVQPGYVPSGTARFMVVNTTSSYNPDTADGPSQSPLREVKVKAKVEAEDGAVDSVYVLNLPEALAVGQAVECTLALVLPAGVEPEDYGGWVFISATDSLGFQVQDSFAVVVSSAEPHQSLDSFRVVPIPFKPNQNPEHDAIHFQGLTAGARVIVYDASGQSVWSETENGDGHLKWDAKVASGIYVYLVVTADGKASKVGKLSVIR